MLHCAILGINLAADARPRVTAIPAEQQDPTTAQVYLNQHSCRLGHCEARWIQFNEQHPWNFTPPEGEAVQY